MKAAGCLGVDCAILHSGNLAVLLTFQKVKTTSIVDNVRSAKPCVAVSARAVSGAAIVAYHSRENHLIEGHIWCVCYRGFYAVFVEPRPFPPRGHYGGEACHREALFQNPQP